MTSEQRYEARRWVGSAPPDVDLDAAYDRLGSMREVIEEILMTRRANFARQPTSISVGGEFSQSVGGKVKEIDDMLAQLAVNDLGTTTDTPPRIKRLSRYGEDCWPGR